jgi:predicted nucleic acid-binding protein
VAALVDTHVLVYRFDPRFPEKQARATELLRAGAADGSIMVPYQALVEFVAAVTRPLAGGPSLLPPDGAYREAEDLLTQFPILYPDEGTYRAALRGVALYQLSWFDACLWAYADSEGITTLWSEDFEHGRVYGRVKVINPFAPTIHEPEPPVYGRRKR